MALSSQDKRKAAADAISKTKDWFAEGKTRTQSRIIHNMDLISEGPIAGLVEGPASVMFDGIPLMDSAFAASNNSSSYSTQIFLTNGSNTATLSSKSEVDIELSTKLTRSRPVNIIKGKGSITCTTTETTIGDKQGLVLTTASDFFNSGMISGKGRDKLNTYQFNSSEVEDGHLIGGFAQFKSLYTFAAVVYTHISGTNNVAGLTSGQTYYVVRRGDEIYLCDTILKAASNFRLFGAGPQDVQDAINITTNANNADSLHSLKLLAPIGVPEQSEILPARLKGNPASGYVDIEGIIHSIASARSATWLPSDGNGSTSFLPPTGSYTLEIDDEVRLNVTKPVEINSGLTAGGLVMAGAGTETYRTGGRHSKNYQDAPDNIKWAFDPGEGRAEFPFSTGLTDGGVLASGTGVNVKSSFVNVGGSSIYGYTYIGYFRPPSSGQYEFKLTSKAYAFLWLGEECTDRGTFRLHHREIAFTKPATSGGRRTSGKPGKSPVTSKKIYLQKDQYYPIRFCFYKADNLKLEWRKHGASFSTDLSSHFYTPDNRDWQNINNVRLKYNWGGATGTYDFNIGEAFVDGETTNPNIDSFSNLTNSNFKGGSVEFRVGNRIQKTLAGDIAAALTSTPTPAAELKQHEDFVIDPTSTKTEHEGVGDTIIQASSSTGLNLTLAQIRQADKVRLTFDYPNGIYHRTKKKGHIGNGYAKYKVLLQFKDTDQTTFNPEKFEISSMLAHSGNTEDSFTAQHDINISKFGPFDDFKIIIQRMTCDTGDAYTGASGTRIGRQDGWANHFATSNIGACTTFILEKTTFPYSALAKTTFSTQEFTQMPQVTYHVRGMKVSVPHNYMTREEVSSGIANYNRNSNGTNSGSYVNWDGSFRDTKVYTNNPAWVFYDIVTNNRYGLGDFVTADDLDKYALYRIARYCDELVSNGQGGLEPRFTCNLYLTRPVDCYKLLKDMATVFRGIIYWHNNKITPVIDMPKDPIYNFSKANIINGNIKYETTGSKTRANQVVVTWNNPANQFKLEALLVEDRKNIIKTGKALSEKAVAFGCTSETQARRYGYWKLWTAANQTRIASFEASIEGNFLSPGDIINISDPSVAPSRKRLAGRISSTSTATTLSTTNIPLDSEVYLDPANTYKLSILLPTGGALLSMDTASEAVVITDDLGNDTSYYAGDFIQKAWYYDNGSYTYGILDTEQKATNCKTNQSGEPLILSWSEHSMIQAKDITLPGGHSASNPLSFVTVAAAFVEVPKTDSVWIIEETSPDGDNTLNSAKQYKIMSLAEGSTGGVSITAVEHFNEKFYDIENEGDFTSPLEVSVPTLEGDRRSSGIGSLEALPVETSEGQGSVLAGPIKPSPVKDLFFKIT